MIVIFITVLFSEHCPVILQERACLQGAPPRGLLGTFVMFIFVYSFVSYVLISHFSLFVLLLILLILANLSTITRSSCFLKYIYQEPKLKSHWSKLVTQFVHPDMGHIKKILHGLRLILNVALGWRKV